MTPFHKVYVNPALGYWKDLSKVEIIIPFSYDPTHDDVINALTMVKYSCLGFDPPISNHLCLGERCLICEAAKLNEP